MKILLVALFLPLLSLHAQDEPGKPSPEAGKKEVPQFKIDLDNLPLEKKKAYWSALIRAEQVFNQKRIFECLESINEAHQIYAKNPSSLNLQGACYVEFRAFDKARKVFAEAQKQDPDNPNVLFNQAEIEFVTENWQTAHDQLVYILPKYKDRNESMRDLIRFKILLCKLKLDDKEGAVAILKDTTFLDDTPLFYYGKGAIAYFEERTVDAEVWLARAGRIFTQPAMISPWQDTLIEFGYIKSFYGGDLEVQESANGE
ncbi:MAG: hypothetical protein QNK61_03290 [Akkermansiaceae bacterium]